MMNAGRMIGHAAVLFVACALLMAPARAQIAALGGDGGGQDMMTQMAPMLNMMKAKMGKRRFGALMQTIGPMMGNMMQGGGGGLGGLSGLGGGLGASGLGGLSGFGGATSTIGSDAPASPAGGSGIMGVLGGDGGSGMMTMIPQLVGLAGGGNSHHRRRRHH